ncbi:MAG: UPF0158 family protein [Parachlamydiaceae bacterium]
MATKQQLEAQNPLILRCNRLMEAFAKSDDERDFYLDRLEGFIVYVDLDKGDDELHTLEKELEKHSERYCMIPKLTFYETKKIMEGFINEKVYDIDTKEKLLDIIQSKEARENFLDFIYDHHSELEKWQTFYQERSRIRIIEWLRVNNFHFVFEEDLEMPRLILEKIKKELFQTKVGKDIQNARKALFAKAKTYYSNEALNPRPKRGRPPKQVQKVEVEHHVTTDIYTTVPNGLRGFLFIPDMHGTSSGSFSSKFGTEGDLFSHKRPSSSDNDLSMESLNQKLETLRSLSSKWKDIEVTKKVPTPLSSKPTFDDFDDDEDEDEDEDEDDLDFSPKGKTKKKALNGKKVPLKRLPTPKAAQKTPIKKVATKKVPAAKAPPKKPVKQPLRRIVKHDKKKLSIEKKGATKSAPKKMVLKKAIAKKAKCRR